MYNVEKQIVMCYLHKYSIQNVLGNANGKTKRSTQ